MTDYPYESTCDNCGMTIQVYLKKDKTGEYARNSKKYINYNAGERPDFHQCRNWKAKKGEKKKEKTIITPPAPPPEKPKSSEKTAEEYLKPRFESADTLPVVKGKVAEINLSRTVSYKYGVAKEYATEKEEIFNSLTYGVRVECEIDNLPVLEKLQTQYGNHINAVLWEDFLKKRKLKLIKGEE